MKMSLIAGTLTFILAAFAGIYFSIGGIRANSSLISLQDSQFSSSSRIPAAIRHDMDFSQLEGSELVSASQKRLLTAARVILQDDQMGIELGHFVLRGESGRSQLACDYYDQVKLTFEAEGIADSGEKPLMEISGPCRPGTDMTRIEPIWIPVSRILSERVNNMDLTDDTGNVSFHFSNMGGEWPGRWALKSARLLNSQESGKEITIEHSDLREILHHPFVLNWQVAK